MWEALKSHFYVAQRPVPEQATTITRSSQIRLRVGDRVKLLSYKSIAKLPGVYTKRFNDHLNECLGHYSWETYRVIKGTTQLYVFGDGGFHRIDSVSESRNCFTIEDHPWWFHKDWVAEHRPRQQSGSCMNTMRVIRLSKNREGEQK